MYDWASELRTVEISKGQQQFQFRKFIETGMADVHGRLSRARFLKGRPAADFAAEAAVILGDINYIHPFREGNGRTQLQYLKQLAAGAGHILDLTRIAGPEWLAASVASHSADYQPMARALEKALKPPSGGR
ncbi:MAG: Fic family protein [Alphaproteobacteria bacterium]